MDMTARFQSLTLEITQRLITTAPLWIGHPSCGGMRANRIAQSAWLDLMGFRAFPGAD